MNYINQILLSYSNISGSGKYFTRVSSKSKTNGNFLSSIKKSTFSATFLYKWSLKLYIYIY